MILVVQKMAAERFLATGVDYKGMREVSTIQDAWCYRTLWSTLIRGRGSATEWCLVSKWREREKGGAKRGKEQRRSIGEGYTSCAYSLHNLPGRGKQWKGNLSFHLFLYLLLIPFFLPLVTENFPLSSLLLSLRFFPIPLSLLRFLALSPSLLFFTHTLLCLIFCCFNPPLIWIKTSWSEPQVNFNGQHQFRTGW